MKTIKGPAVFLARFAADTPPFDSLPAIARWAAGPGYKGVQIPSWDARLIDLRRAAEGAPFIARHIIRTAQRAFDDFAASGVDRTTNRRVLGLM